MEEDKIINFFDNSDDRLGRLAEINKNQMEQAMCEMTNFARTDSGFEIVKNSNKTELGKKDI